MNKRFLIMAVCILLIGIVAIFFLVQKNSFSVGLQPGSVNYPMMHAIVGGFFEKEGLKPKVEVFRSANDALDALLGGSIFIDAVIPIQNIASIEVDHPGSIGIAALLISDKNHPLDYLVVPASSSISTPSELAGKTLVVFPGSYSETLTRLTFEKIGISNVKFIKRAPSDMSQALQSGEADAGIFYDPVATQAVAEGWGKIIESGFWEQYLIPEIVVGAYAYNLPEARRNPNLTNKVIIAIQNAIKDSRKNPEAAKASIKHYLGAFEAIVDELPDVRVELPREIKPEIIEQTLKLYKEHGIIQETVDLRPLFYYEAKNEK